jgi:hypothetical protein
MASPVDGVIMAEPEVRAGQANAAGHDAGPTTMPVAEAAGRQMRAPWAASVAGLLFSFLFTAALALLRSPAGGEELASRLATGHDLAITVGGLYLLPFSGVMFLWFVAVIRDQIGEREDRFFATVFLGGGLLFVALVFAAAAVVSTPTALVEFMGQAPPSVEVIVLLRALAYTIMFGFATRGAAIFMLATATIGIRSGVFPRWFALTGYLLGFVLLLAVSFSEAVILILPAWVAITSLFILRRERTRRQTADTAG